MLWHQSLKSIHYRTLLIFQSKKKQIWGSKHGWDKRHVIPSMSKLPLHVSITPIPPGFTPLYLAMFILCVIKPIWTWLQHWFITVARTPTITIMHFMKMLRPTRSFENSHSLIDNNFSNNLCKPHISGILTHHILITLWIFALLEVKPRKKPIPTKYIEVENVNPKSVANFNKMYARMWVNSSARMNKPNFRLLTQLCRVQNGSVRNCCSSQCWQLDTIVDNMYLGADNSSRDSGRILAIHSYT